MSRLIVLTTLALTLSACSSFRHKTKSADAGGTPEATATDKKSNAEESGIIGLPPAPKVGGEDLEEKTTTQHEATHEEPTDKSPAKAEAPRAEKTKPNETKSTEHINGLGAVSPEKSLGWLKNGNTRFRKGYFRKDGASKSDITRLSTGQKPHAIVLSCSDSRVPPEIVFDQKLGEIFVVRTAGEVIEPSTIGSIEYGVLALGARLILVMGHSKCGAVRAALDTLSNKDAGSENLNKLTALIHPHFKNIAGKVVSKDLSQESWANTEGTAADLLEKSKVIRERVQRGEVQIKTALYSVDSGLVDFGEK